jgi:hypothetical protein
VHVEGLFDVVQHQPTGDADDLDVVGPEVVLPELVGPLPALVGATVDLDGQCQPPAGSRR